jgi:hypothetical protein
LTCNDDYTGCTNNESRIVFDVTQGESYMLRLGGFGETAPGLGGQGTFIINQFTPTVTNDFCVSAQVVSLGSDQPFTNIMATTDGPNNPGNSACFGFNDITIQTDIWYKFVAPSTTTIEWSTCDQVNFDSRLAVYGPDATCPVLTDDLYGCNDDRSGCMNFTSKLFFDVEQGRTYYLRLGGFGGEQGAGTFDLVETVPPVPPANDLCTEPVSAWIVTQQQADDFENYLEGTTINATFDQNNFIYPNPQCYGTNFNGGEFADVWYYFNNLGNEELEFRF